MKYCKIIFCIALLAMVGCNTSKKINKEYLYFQKGLDSLKADSIVLKEMQIKSGDQLAIQVYSYTLNQEQVMVFNLPNGNSGASTSGSSSGGYTVDEDGNISLPVIGSVHTEGLTIRKLVTLLKDKIGAYVKGVDVTVKFVNFKVNVLGEVSSPGVKNLPGQKTTILDLISICGDLTENGRRDSILVLRVDSGKVKRYELNIMNASFMYSPAYQLQQNDLVYVRADDEKLAKSKTTKTDTLLKNLQIGVTILSLLTVPLTLYNLLRR